MQLVTFTHRVELTFSKTAGQLTRTIEPRVPYVFSANQYHKVIDGNASIKACVLNHSVFDVRVRPFLAATDGGGRSLAFYAGAGGYGDQMMTWPIVKLLHERGYRVTVLVDPGNVACWEHFPWVAEIEQLPLPCEFFTRFDHLALYELVTNVDEHPDQLHPVDNLLHRLGFDHRQVPPDKKVVRPEFTTAELEAAQKAIAGRQVGVYQLSSSSLVRSLLPADSRALAVELSKAFPDIHWLAVYDRFNKKEYCAPLEGAPDNLEFKTFDRLRDLIAVISLSKVVVSIDSLAIHAAGTCGVPCVGLWGSVDPNKRVPYYANHLAVWQRQACQFAPCFWPNPESFPSRCPSLASLSCAVLERDTRLAVKAVRQLLKL